MLKSALFAVAAVFAASSAQSEDIVGWNDNVQGWTVAVDRTISNSCFILAQVERDTLIRLQFNASEPGVQMIIADRRWSHLDDGADYDLVVTMGQNTPWSGEAKARFWQGVLPSLIVSTAMQDAQAHVFINELSDAGQVRIDDQSGEILNVDLTGIDAALQEMFACQSAMTAEHRAGNAA